MCKGQESFKIGQEFSLYSVDIMTFPLHTLVSTYNGHHQSVNLLIHDQPKSQSQKVAFKRIN